MRTGDDIQATVQSLNEACHGEHKSANKPVILAATNASADGYNEAGMAALQGPSCRYQGIVMGEFRSDRYPAPDNLELKKNARIMLVKNDAEKRWVNGSLATVTRLTAHLATVRHMSHCPRATTLQGLSFATPLRIDDIKVDRSLVDGVQSLL